MAALPPLHNQQHLGGRGARTGVTLELRPAGEPDTESQGKAVGGQVCYTRKTCVTDKLRDLIEDLENRKRSLCTSGGSPSAPT